MYQPSIFLEQAQILAYKRTRTAPNRFRLVRLFPSKGRQSGPFSVATYVSLASGLRYNTPVSSFLLSHNSIRMALRRPHSTNGPESKPKPPRIANGSGEPKHSHDGGAEHEHEHEHTHTHSHSFFGHSHGAEGHGHGAEEIMAAFQNASTCQYVSTCSPSNSTEKPTEEVE